MAKLCSNQTVHQTARTTGIWLWFLTKETWSISRHQYRLTLLSRLNLIRQQISTSIQANSFTKREAQLIEVRSQATSKIVLQIQATPEWLSLATIRVMSRPSVMRGRYSSTQIVSQFPTKCMAETLHKIKKRCDEALSLQTRLRSISKEWTKMLML